MAFTKVIDTGDSSGLEFISSQGYLDIINDVYANSGVDLECLSPDGVTWVPLYETTSNFTRLSLNEGFTRINCPNGLRMRFVPRSSRTLTGNRVYVSNVQLVPTA